MSVTIHRVVGDHGELARIRINNLRDVDGQPVTGGTVTLRAATLFELPMTHTGDGNWYADPADGDLDRAGAFPLEVRVDGSQVTVPSRGTWMLAVRAPVDPPS